MWFLIVSLTIKTMSINSAASAAASVVSTVPPAGNSGSFVNGEHSYCQSEYFRVRCGPAEVVVVTHARYGRMHISRCVREDFGYVGCSADVRDILDQHCSGRRACNVRVLDDNFENVRPCHDDLKSYLEVEYDCVKATPPRPSNVSPFTDVQSSFWRSVELETVGRIQSGYLAGVWAAEAGCGTGDWPWTVRLRRGQRINVTVFDFSVPRSSSQSTAAELATVSAGGGPRLPSGFTRSVTAYQQNNVSTTTALPRFQSSGGQNTRVPSTGRQHNVMGICKSLYVVIREPDGHTLTVCSGVARRSVYESRSHVIEIRVVGSKTALHSAGILVRFDAVGCPDIETPAGGWVKRISEDIITVGCSTSPDSLEFRCHGNSWVAQPASAKAGFNCSTVGEDLSSIEQYDRVADTTLTGSTGRFNVGVIGGGYRPQTRLFHKLSLASALAIISVIALLVGLLILAVGIVLLNRLQRSTVGNGSGSSERDESFFSVEPNTSSSTSLPVAQRNRRQNSTNTVEQRPSSTIIDLPSRRSLPLTKAYSKYASGCSYAEDLTSSTACVSPTSTCDVHARYSCPMTLCSNMATGSVPTPCFMTSSSEDSTGALPMPSADWTTPGPIRTSAACCDSLTPSVRLCSYAAAVVNSSSTANQKGTCARSSLYVVGD